MKKFFVVILTFLISLLSFGKNGIVTKVSDGDSFYMKLDGKKVRVRMYGIDAPELSQTYGEEAKKYLEKLILGKKVDLDILYEDKYKRKIARVYFKGREINLEMLRAGQVWFYEYHAKNEKAYREAYEEAKREKRGLWSYKNPENPREYRLKHRRK